MFHSFMIVIEQFLCFVHKGTCEGSVKINLHQVGQKLPPPPPMPVRTILKEES